VAARTSSRSGSNKKAHEPEQRNRRPAEVSSCDDGQLVMVCASRCRYERIGTDRFSRPAPLSCTETVTRSVPAPFRGAISRSTTAPPGPRAGRRLRRSDGLGHRRSGGARKPFSHSPGLHEHRDDRGSGTVSRLTERRARPGTRPGTCSSPNSRLAVKLAREARERPRIRATQVPRLRGIEPGRDAKAGLRPFAGLAIRSRPLFRTVW
jgi:hypothetical protein